MRKKKVLCNNIFQWIQAIINILCLQSIQNEKKLKLTSCYEIVK